VRSPDITDPLAALLPPLVGVFLLGGLLASTEALIVPRLQLALHLGYARSLSIQLVYYAGYLLLAWPAMIATERFGPIRTMAAALALVAAGCVLLAGAQDLISFPAMLGALFCLSCGITGLQVACNGLAATAGSPARAASRFTRLQGFNSLGTVIGPLIASGPLLGQADGQKALLLCLLFAVLFGALSLRFARAQAEAPAHRPATNGRAIRLVGLLRKRPVAAGTAAIFAYVGAEVTVGSLAVAYLLHTRVTADPVTAGRLVSLYWGGAMLGRFAGAAMLRNRPARDLLTWAAAGAVVLAVLAVLLPGSGGGIALLALGLCNSIMFPVIYGLAMPSDRRDVPLASMLLSMAVVGGAVIPGLTGLIADRFSIRPALALPALCYLVILAFAMTAPSRRSAE
jgi:FHS family L-fucose permease-like MFS transporter